MCCRILDRACAWFLEITFLQDITICVRLPPLRLLITIHMKLTLNNQLNKLYLTALQDYLWVWRYGLSNKAHREFPSKKSCISHSFNNKCCFIHLYITIIVSGQYPLYITIIVSGQSNFVSFLKSCINMAQKFEDDLCL